MKEKMVSAIIPTKNEAVGIREVIEGVKPFVDEIIIVDGHSEDGTAELAREMGVRVILDSQKGKGVALRTGFPHAKGEIIVFMDADGSHEPSDIKKLLEPVVRGDADMVIGSRIKGGSDEFYINFDNLIRQIGNDFLTWMINLRWNQKLSDVQNGFRAVKKSVLEVLDLKAKDFDIEQEMVMKCLKKGFKIGEVNSHEYERKWGESKLKTRKGWVFLWRLIIDIW